MCKSGSMLNDYNYKSKNLVFKVFLIIVIKAKIWFLKFFLTKEWDIIISFVDAHFKISIL